MRFSRMSVSDFAAQVRGRFGLSQDQDAMIEGHVRRVPLKREDLSLLFADDLGRTKQKPKMPNDLRHGETAQVDAQRALRAALYPTD